jgi:hypothetical protein
VTNATIIFDNAELALAAYANLQEGQTSRPENIDALAGPTGAGMSDTQVVSFAARYPIVVWGHRTKSRSSH